MSGYGRWKKGRLRAGDTYVQVPKPSPLGEAVENAAKRLQLRMWPLCVSAQACAHSCPRSSAGVAGGPCPYTDPRSV
jgi:hypothetical protein